MIYLCEGCDATFEGTAEEAFKSNWDTPERFGYTTCTKCPITKSVWWARISAAMEKK